MFNKALTTSLVSFESIIVSRIVLLRMVLVLLQLFIKLTLDSIQNVLFLLVCLFLLFVYLLEVCFCICISRCSKFGVTVDKMLLKYKVSISGKALLLLFLSLFFFVVVVVDFVVIALVLSCSFEFAFFVLF